MIVLRAVLLALAAAGLAAGILFALAFRDRYWLRRDCFNELGRCWDPVEEQVFLEGAGMIWGSLTALAFLAAAAASLAARRLGRPPTARAAPDPRGPG